MNSELNVDVCLKYSINNGFIERGKNERDLQKNLSCLKDLPSDSRKNLSFMFGSASQLFVVGNPDLYVVRGGRIESFQINNLHSLEKKGKNLKFHIQNNSYKLKFHNSEIVDELYTRLSKLTGLKPVIRKQREKRGNGMKTFMKSLGIVCVILVVGAIAYFVGIKVGTEDSKTAADPASSKVSSSLTSSGQENTSNTDQNTQSGTLTKGTVEGISSVVDEMQADFDETVKKIRKDSSNSCAGETVSRHINNNLIDMEDYEKTGGDFYPEAVAYLEYLKETMDLFDQAYLQGGDIDETYLNAGMDNWETSKVKRQEYETQLQKAQEEVGIKASTV